MLRFVNRNFKGPDPQPRLNSMAAKRKGLLAELAALRERAKRACAKSKTLRIDRSRLVDRALFTLAAAAKR